MTILSAIRLTLYAAPDARRSFFTGSIEPLGTVRAQICPACGRIIMHGCSHFGSCEENTDG